ncbi:CPBP family intramembrane glutamic endopeptidase [Sphaerochaeta sp.]|uniref:CPBP family intramembrane glutamic endopeptidase n=1 Tax=Sphaerochaeta sp. TaxID=1972642 RepID=UPI002FC5E741
MEKERKIQEPYAASPLASSLSAVLALTLWLSLGPTFTILLQPFHLPYLTANAPFLAMALGIVLARYALVKQPFIVWVTDEHAFNFSRFTRSFLAYTGMATVFLLYGLTTQPYYYTKTADPLLSKVFLFVLILMFTPLQTTCEEITFRILPSRVLLRTRLQRGLLPTVLTSLFIAFLFTVPHLSNHEVQQAHSRFLVLAYYALFGLSVTLLCLEQGGFEPALAIHAANNLFVAVVCNYQGSSLPSLPIWQTTRPVGTVFDLVQLMCSIALVSLVLPHRTHKN